MKKFLKEFSTFISKGSIIDLAIGIVIGTAFQAIVKSLVNDVIMPVIGVIANFNLQTASIILVKEVVEGGLVTQGAVLLRYGSFIQSIIDFLIIGLTLFVTLKIINGAKTRFVRQQIKYLKKLKKKNPELFTKEDSLGNIQYNELKAKHPEYFDVEKKKEVAPVVAKPTTEELLSEIIVVLKEKNK
ncbi:MAG TPA: large conductance mechanosensitive channel protein MscL [Bacilli bacterium]|nr:large conductance mechanosensitive channel protein MscL [Bacilli bacterium]